MYTLDPGQLRDRIEIQRRATGQDALGQPVQGWEQVAKVWANVRHLNGAEAIKAGAVTSAVNASIRIRWRAGIDAGQRVVFDGRVYEIKAVLPDRRELIDLVCEVVNA